ncbi:hypothetical protein GGS23DRAFT_196592 [Durotheca rogersii]|uniref:uncharacterized protein n=1 Tax=Durotheca rogersii TaxID=419775 RepID=UPI00221EB511|nr:uncharacterized protein GGS23DRAFT_196592 [Durotheca rogersii]KAI5867799.1 hypothetical protein GGS23DRAFT_196592 [Durotheca rogersii]
MTNCLFRRPPGLIRLSRHALALRQRCMSTVPTMQASAPFRTRKNPYEKPQIPKSNPKKYFPASEEDVQPGDHVLAVSRKYNIGFPTALHWIKDWKPKSNPCQLNVMISERHCFSVTSMRYLDKFEHPFAKSVLGFYIAKTDIPLWHNAYSHPVAKACVCQVAARKIQRAFRDSLAAHGYDKDGRKTTTDDAGVRQLYGTARISCGNPKAACNIQFADLLDQINPLVDALEVALGRDKYGDLLFRKKKRPEIKRRKPHREENRRYGEDGPDRELARQRGSLGSLGNNVTRGRGGVRYLPS